MTLYAFSAPAKVNLVLRVVGRRADGYHLLETVMTFFPLQDLVRIDLDAPGVTLACQPPMTEDPEQNLALRAARSLARLAGRGRGARMLLEKRIPAGAGLGGGSSDAATILLALNRLWDLGLTLEELIEVGLPLGADVPIFLGGRAALAEGVGERLTPLPHLPEFPMVVLNPGTPVSTREAFGRFAAGQLTNHSAPISIPDSRQGDGVDSVVQMLDNDLEPVVRAMTPAVGEASRQLRQAGASGVRMSGSGSSVFGLFHNIESARAAVHAIGAQYPEWRLHCGITLNRHPFAAEWARQTRRG